MRAVCSGTGRRGCCGWSDMAKPPEITAPTPLSTFRLTHSPTVSGRARDHDLAARPVEGEARRNHEARPGEVVDLDVHPGHHAIDGWHRHMSLCLAAAGFLA